MPLLETYIIILFTALVLLPFLNVKWKGIATLLTVIISASICVFIAVNALLGHGQDFMLQGTYVTGEIPIRIDALSGWFILIINFGMVTGALYGLQYMKAYKKQTSNITLHCLAYLGVQAGLTFVCVVQNAIAFLIVWEIMALSCFLLIIFEHYKQDTIKAGINFLIQSHIGILFLYIGFIWVGTRMNSYDFLAITAFSNSFSQLSSLALFLCFFIGFAIKAGFVPFHTWLPYAHPASPSHISGVMSGVIIKIGIYGILRMLLLIKTDYLLLGFIILFISVVSGVYGVMLAIIQHNLKKLLAYHSIENIGIIGIGIGLGTIGLGTNNQLLTTLGFAGAMLHVLNHSLFKSLLFYGAGNVYQSTHTMNIDSLGGLIKKMPHTAILFLIAALAICGLPPFNGFISEFLIYSGLFKGMHSGTMFLLLSLLSSVFGMVLIGGLALLCFTKAFGAVFLGNSRHKFLHQPSEASIGKLIPMYIIVGLIIAIGLFPNYFIQSLANPLKLFTNKLSVIPNMMQPIENTVYTMQYIGWCAVGVVFLTTIVFLIRKHFTNQKTEIVSSTWGCGYIGNTSKMQYTASSFIRSYRKLAEPMLSIRKIKKEINGVFPQEGRHETHPYDKVEEWFIDKPVKQMKYFFGKFRFLQNGNLQSYLLYGFVFIILVMSLPLLYGLLMSLKEFLNQL